MRSFKRYFFTDGYFCDCTGYSKNELAWEELRHGKLVKVQELVDGKWTDCGGR